MKTTKPKGENGLQCAYQLGGARLVLVSDIIVLLYERGQKDLAKEVTLRCEKSFEVIDKKNKINL